MKLYKHYFKKDDTPFNSTYQQKKQFHTAWFKTPYIKFLEHTVYKIKFLGLFTLWEAE